MDNKNCQHKAENSKSVFHEDCGIHLSDRKGNEEIMWELQIPQVTGFIE
jgi:hypothetical protein